MANVSRGTRTDLIGTQASPASIIHGANSSGSMTWAANSGQFDGYFACDITKTTVLTTGPTIQWTFTIDGTHWHNEAAVTGALTASTTETYSYQPPPGVLGVQCTVTNNDSTVTITCWCEGQILQA